MPVGTSKAQRQVHVIIAGAGPAGLLAAIKLLARNDADKAVDYSVEIVEGSEDFGSLEEASIEKKRSWMIGLSTHGLTALRSVPGLYEDYVSKVGVQVDGAVIYPGSAKIVAKDEENSNNFVVDRNFIVRQIARFLNDRFQASGKLTMRYSTRVNFVDGDRKRVFVTDGEGKDMYLPYDLLLGCDGVRSAVRAAIMAKHRDFECTLTDIFCKFKAVHVDIDKVKHKGIPIETNLSHVFPDHPTKFNGIGLVETGGKINLALGYQKHHEDVIAQEMLSKDAEVVAKYLRENFKAFTLPYEDFAEQWVKQDWSTTSMVYCNYYHSSRMGIVLMGDAAHATSPAIGQGMNTALADALAFDQLLDRCDDDLSLVLPAYSEERVKEGNALTSIAFHAYSLDTKQQFRVMLSIIARSALRKLFPRWVAEDPTVGIGKGEKLSKVYNDLTKMGRLPAVRTVCERLRREHFEKTTGMVVDAGSSASGWRWILGMLLVIGLTSAACLLRP